MKKLILTQGCPGSGKSTWANEYVQKNPGFFILTRDDFREKLFGLEARNQYRFSKAKEKSVSAAQFAAAEALLKMETTKGVIIADTNLNPSTIEAWHDFAYKSFTDVLMEIERFDVPWTELLKRNQYRGDKAVPIDVLRSMYKLSRPHDVYVPDESLPKAVIFDLDGTLADNDHRSPYDLEKCGEDAPKKMVIALLEMLRAQGYKIITVSGRESGTKDDKLKYRRITKEWLKTHTNGSDEHYQRLHGDSRKDDVVKEEIFWNCIADRFNVVLTVDDRDTVVEMWRRIGLECWQVQFGNF